MLTLNSTAASLRMGADAGIYERALRGFISILPAFVPDLDSAVKAGDSAAALRLLHAMHGVAATVGAEQLSAALGALERELTRAPDAVYHCVLEPIRQVVAETVEAVLAWLDQAENRVSEQRM